MSDRSRTSALGSLLGGAHLLFALLPLVFLVLALFYGARSGFAVDRSRFGRSVFHAELQGPGMVATLLAEADAENIGVAVWGLADEADGKITADSPGVQLAGMFARAGMQVRVHDPLGAAAAMEFLGDTVHYARDPYVAAAGAHVLVVACDWPSYRDVDMPQVAKSMFTPRGLFDCYSLYDPDVVGPLGMQHVDYGVPAWPLWLDDGVQEYVAELDAQLREDSRILVMPGHLIQNPELGPTTDSPRSRSFLYLNYALLPRQLFLIEPVLASGTVSQYQDWIVRMAETPPLDDVQRQRAVDLTGVDHILFYRISQIFRRREYGLAALQMGAGKR
ncbi:MAG TPA: UDP-glucose/GDP-mannose dehydrogenase family protein [Planctomycetota bacterium]